MDILERAFQEERMSSAKTPSKGSLLVKETARSLVPLWWHDEGEEIEGEKVRGKNHEHRAGRRILRLNTGLGIVIVSPTRVHKSIVQTTQKGIIFVGGKISLRLKTTLT